MGGHNKSIPFSNYKEATEVLMERTLPQILEDRQTEPVFMPETHLPTVPRVVDMQKYEERKKSLDALAIENPKVLEELDMKPGPPVELTLAKGDLAEKELVESLKEYFASSPDKEVVVYQGPQIRKPGGGKGKKQENDVVIISKRTKTVSVIESKTNLNGKTGADAAKQIKTLKEILIDYFAPDLADWCFVGMIYTNVIHRKLQICSDCSPFIINGPKEVTKKLDNIEALLTSVRPQKVVPSHAEYKFLVESVTFVVLAQPVSTHCTIVSDVVEKVYGKVAAGKTKAKAGQGDFRSVIFWTKQQAKIILTERQFVFFISPWSTGKTLLMREKAVMWATQNPTEKLFFVVVRYEDANLTSLLEIELKDFFNQQHNLKNVEVLGLPIEEDDILSSLLKEVTNQPQGSSFMVDELVIPEGDDEEDDEDIEDEGEKETKPKEEKKIGYEQFTEDLVQLQKHFEVQPAKPLLWIACAGIVEGKAEHFERTYLTSILPPAFHLPEMDMPLRNTKQTLAMARLEGNQGLKALAFHCGQSIYTNPVYKVPSHLMEGVEGKDFLVKNILDEEEVATAVAKATKEVFRRTGGAGFPLLSFDLGSTQSAVKKGLERAGATALVYHRGSNESCSEVEVKKWLKRRRIGEEERVLIAEQDVSRGWECSHVLVVCLGGGGMENLVMRTVGYCAIVKEEKN